jgi:hypothetical protein
LLRVVCRSTIYWLLVSLPSIWLTMSLSIAIDRTASLSIYQQIASQIREEICGGRLLPVEPFAGGRDWMPLV